MMRSRLARTLAAAGPVLALALLAMVLPVNAQIPTPTGPGPNDDITDVAGIGVGHFTDSPGRTGVTVIYADGGAVGGVDVRGGWPGTVETDLLDPRNLVHRLNAVVLSGGGVFGLQARTGVMRCLEEAGQGFAVGTPDQVVPIVPGAVIEDFSRANLGAGPSEDNGYAACQAALSGGAVDQGNVGAGTGAVSGGIKGGFGSASSDLGNGVMIGAAVVVNSLGKAWKPKTCEPNVDYLFTGGFGSLGTPSAAACAAAGIGTPQIVGNVVGVVATNFALDKPETQKMAGIAQDGVARAIAPSHTLYDGDVAFGMATGTIQSVGQCLANTPGLVPTFCALVLNDIYAAAADTISIAVMRALLNASSVAGIRSFCDTFSACGSASASTGGNPAAPDTKARAPVRPKVKLPVKTPLPATKPLGGAAAELIGFGAVAFLSIRRVWGGRRSSERKPGSTTDGGGTP